MDALSHALIGYVLFSSPQLSPLVPFVILGAVLPDIDIMYSLFSDASPSLYLFTHGGIAHSFAGALALTLIAYGCVVMLSAAQVIPVVLLTGAGATGFFAILAGALLHLAIDISAMPGIPVLAPFSDRKYTLGILPGPSILLAFAAIGAMAVTVLQVLPLPSALRLYGGMVLAYFAVRTVMFLYAGNRLTGRKIPTVNPFRWLVIRENGISYTVQYSPLFSKSPGEAVFEKFLNTDKRELAATPVSPEVRRFLFHAYCVTAERIGSVLVLADPVRENGYIWYPAKFRRVEIPLEPEP